MLQQKVLALFPLLGWFYLSIIGIFAVTLLLRNKFRPFLRLIYLGFAVFALFLASRALFEEFRLSWQERQYFFSSFETKSQRDKGTYYQIYYQYFRPRVTKYEFLNFIDNSSQEFLFARMYLYPTVVIHTSGVATRQSPYILTNQGLLVKKGVGKVMENYRDEKFILDASQPLPIIPLDE